MSIVASERLAVQSAAPVASAPLTHQPASSALSPTAAMAHPSRCPSWCKDRSYPTNHHFGPTSTWHWSPQYQVPNPRPLDDGPETLLRAELVRNDEDSDTGAVSLYFQAEGDIDLNADEADIFIAQAQAWVDTLRVLRRQMG